MKKYTILFIWMLGNLMANGQRHINYDQQGKLKIVAEDIQLNIVNETKTISPKESSPDPTVKAIMGAPILSALLPLAIDLVKTGISNYNEREKAAYEGSYSVKGSGDALYNKDYTAVNLPKLNIQRSIITVDGAKMEAANIELIPSLSADNKAFHYKLGQVNYPIFIAKVKNDYDYIIPTIELKFTIYYMHEGEIKNLESTAQLKMPPIQIGVKDNFQNQQRYSDWIVLPPKSTDASKANIEMCLYEIEATVNETNLYKSKAIERDANFDNNQEASIKLLNEILKQGLEKKD